MDTILAINSAFSYTEIALVRGDKTIYYKGKHSNKDEAESLLNSLLEIKNNKIDKVVVVSGPGGFTGLRVGITMANTIAYVNNIEIESITSNQILRLKSPKNTIIVNRSNIDECKIKLKTNKNIKFITGDIDSKQLKKYIPKGVKWIDLHDLTPLNQVVIEKYSNKKTAKTNRNSAKTNKNSAKTNKNSAKIIKPKYFAPPSITKSKKEIFK